MKRLTICFATFGFVLGLGALGCTEHNPAFHKAMPADGGTPAPSQDGALDLESSADRPPTDTREHKDTEPRFDTGNLLRETGLDTVPVMPDAQEPDDRDGGGKKDGKNRDTNVDSFVPDGKVVPPPDVKPVSPDTEAPDTSPVTPDTADASPEIDGPESDAGLTADAPPDTGEADAGTDADDTQPDSQPPTEN